jgi:hypothetical protein
MNAVTVNMRAQPQRHVTGLNLGDDSREGYKSMDWPSAVRLMGRKHIRSMQNLRMGRNNLIADPTVQGMLEYLRICRLYTSIFADESLKHTERVRRAAEVVTHLRLWRQWIINTKGQTLEKNFITTQSYQDILLSCHAAVLIIMTHRDLTPDQPLNLNRSGTDCCEDFFGDSGASVANKRVFSTLEARWIIQKLNTVQVLAAEGGFKLPGSKKHREQFFDDEGEPIIGPEDWADDQELNKWWLKGVKDGYKGAEKYHMKPTTRPLPEWWTHPEKGEKGLIASAGDGISDDDAEDMDDSDDYGDRVW